MNNNTSWFKLFEYKFTFKQKCKQNQIKPYYNQEKSSEYQTF